MDCARNIITANFSGGGTSATTAPLWQWDYGQVLCVTGIDLPAAFEVHFSTNRTGGVSTVAVGADGQVTIPNDLLTIGKNLNAWIYLSDSEGEGETEYSILIPVKARPMPETYDAEVTGEFDDVVRQVSEYAETAQTAADNAGASATAAAASASEAAASASAAETAKTASETAQGKAEDAQAAAETAAQTATEKAQQTAQDAAQAAQSKADAESAAQRAEAAQTGAESAKTGAETAAQGAAASASAASASATSAGQAATSAGQSATAAAGSATTAGNAAQTATTKAGEASASATAANTAKTAAQTAQTGAETAATNAGQSASTASTKAAEAAQSASNAADSETAAEAAATRAETAAASLTVDSALSETSENPVQNKIITESVTRLKSALNPLYGETELELVNGSYWLVSGSNAGNPLNYVGWSRTDRIPCVPGELLKITATVRSQYNLFFNSDTDGDMNSAFTLNVGENNITVPTGATYFGLSNTTAGMNGTTLVKIVNASEVKSAENNANAALTESESNARSIDAIERYVRLKASSATADISSLVALTAINRRTDFFPATEIKSVSVNAVSGYQHNINYFKVSASDADAVTEAGWQNDATSFTKPDGYLYWYVRFRKADQSTFTDADVNTLLASLVVTLDYDTISIPEQTVCVATTGADTNDGSKSAPFATLQKAVDSGALVVKASPGNYTGFSVQNRETPLTIMLDSMPVYSTENPEAPKIKITTGVSGGYGIYASNCTEINLFDVWVDGVTADCMWLQDIGNVNCTRCFVSNNSANNSMGFRLISVNGVFRDCKAWNIVKDGFNIHRYGNTQFINCVAYDCGDDGISHHDGCTGLISGGEYYRCYKGGISSPYGGAKIDIENVYIHDCTQYGIYSMSTAEMLKSSGRISNCVIKNNGTYDIIATHTDLIGWNNIYDTKSIGTQATFTEFS